VIVGVLTLVYTFEGGIAAVIWTDLIQLIIYIGGSLLAAYELVHLVPGGWSTIASSRGGQQVSICIIQIRSKCALHLLGGIIGRHIFDDGVARDGSVVGQRLLTCRNKRESQKALILAS
jgi:hypothetical protein